MLPPSALNEEQAIALLLAVRTSPLVQFDSFGKVLANCKSLLQAHICPAKQREVRHLTDSVYFASADERPNVSKQLQLLFDAISAQQMVWIKYRERSDQAQTTCVLPLQLVHTQNQWWFLGKSEYHGNSTIAFPVVGLDLVESIGDRLSVGKQKTTHALCSKIGTGPLSVLPLTELEFQNRVLRRA